ncbi:MAG: hypothetical protein WB586_00630 [Chthoniobacterales bacterium]
MFTFPTREPLVKCRVNDGFWRVRNVDQVRTARKQKNEQEQAPTRNFSVWAVDDRNTSGNPENSPTKERPKMGADYHHSPECCLYF